ncbi:hypothetical protein J8TS2_41570 [Lederbergia ruris]|uniref:Uncharacterized protein n=1 Tax=Lederbergia ruris TaxID=217495 RepID=A0ABQ4KPH5_9BACI|nr:hypothetical protein J8TS2_41570 [Lederbergia ruris]
MSCKKHSRCNNCVAECRNNRIESDAVIQCDSLLIHQDFCVDARVGVEEAAATTFHDNCSF